MTMSRPLPDVSVIVPVYNRGELIRYTLESVRRAARQLEVETIVVDDGSERPVAGDLVQLGYAPDVRVIAQRNQGLLFARLAGLSAAVGRYVLFLDSDDLITPDKLAAQVTAMDHESADVSYTDSARTALDADYERLTISPCAAERATNDPTELFIDIQPPPHSPMFDRRYLQQIVADPLFPPTPLYNAVAEIWFYHNAAPRPGRALYVPGPRAIIGQHPGTRLTNHWERLGVASLAVMEAFARSCTADTPHARGARQLVAEKAFRAWRRLPRGFSAEFCERQLVIWSELHAVARLPRLGGKLFQSLARVLGPIAAGRILRWRNDTYDSCRTMDDESVAAAMATIRSG